MRAFGRAIQPRFAGRDLKLLRMNGADLFRLTEVDPEPVEPPTPPLSGMPERPDSSSWPVYNVPTSGSHSVNLNGGYARLVWPNQAVSTQLTLNDARGVHSVGGYVTGSTYAGKTIILRNMYSDAIFYFEGLHVDVQYKVFDIFNFWYNVSSRPGKFYWVVANSRLGTPEYEYGPGGFHGDLMQWNTSNPAPAQQVFWRNVTGQTNGTGNWLPDARGRSKTDGVLASLNLDRVNLRYGPESTVQQLANNNPNSKNKGSTAWKPERREWFYLTGAGAAQNPTSPWYPVNLNEVYFDIAADNRSLIQSWYVGDGASWTFTDKYGNKGPGNRTETGGVMTWANDGDIDYTGEVRLGPPPGGDFAPANKVGINYDPDDPIWG